MKKLGTCLVTGMSCFACCMHIGSMCGTVKPLAAWMLSTGDKRNQALDREMPSEQQVMCVILLGGILWARSGVMSDVGC